MSEGCAKAQKKSMLCLMRIFDKGWVTILVAGSVSRKSRTFVPTMSTLGFSIKKST
jgi:hypothetical protein